MNDLSEKTLPRYSQVTTVVQPKKLYRVYAPGAVSTASQANCSPWFIVLITLGGLFFAAIIIAATILGILGAAGVLSPKSSTTYYFYCPEGTNIYYPMSVPTSDDDVTDWQTMSNNRWNSLLYFNAWFKIKLCGTDTSASNKYYCKLRLVTTNYYDSYCSTSCVSNSFTDCNTPTITSSPLESAVPFYTVTLTHGQTTNARAVFASSSFKYVSCPTTSNWDVS